MGLSSIKNDFDSIDIASEDLELFETSKPSQVMNTFENRKVDDAINNTDGSSKYNVEYCWNV